MQRTFVEALARELVILAEGSVIERLRRDPVVVLDDHILHSGFIYSETGRERLAAIYREYLSIGFESRLPMLLFTPTWRASFPRIRAAGMTGRDLNGDAVRFLQELRAGYGGYRDSVWIGGLIGVYGDAYRPEEALPEETAVAFHQPQIDALAASGPDFLSAATIPSATEGIGIARAMSATGLPYVPSFIIGPGARLLDGSPLADVVRRIDDTVSSPPAGYMVNCVHHSAFANAVERLDDGVRRRLLGLQANTSARSPEELDGLEELDSEPAEVFGSALAALHRRFGCRVLGGCCGSDGSHIRSLAGLLRQSPAV